MSLIFAANTHGYNFSDNATQLRHDGVQIYLLLSSSVVNVVSNSAGVLLECVLPRYF